MFYLILPALLLLGQEKTPLRLAMLTVGFVTLAQIIHRMGAGFGPFGEPGFPSQAAVFPLFGLEFAASRYPASPIRDSVKGMCQRCSTFATVAVFFIIPGRGVAVRTSAREHSCLSRAIRRRGLWIVYPLRTACRCQ